MEKKHIEYPENLSSAEAEILALVFEEPSISMEDRDVLMEKINANEELKSFYQALQLTASELYSLEAKELPENLHGKIMETINAEKILVDTIQPHVIKAPLRKKKSIKERFVGPVTGSKVFITFVTEKLWKRDMGKAGLYMAASVLALSIIIGFMGNVNTEKQMLENGQVAVESEEAGLDVLSKDANMAPKMANAPMEMDKTYATVSYKNPWKEYPFSTSSSIKYYEVNLLVEDIDEMYSFLQTFGEIEEMNQWKDVSERTIYESMYISMISSSVEADMLVSILANKATENEFSVIQRSENVSKEVEALRVEISAKEKEYERLLEKSDSLEEIKSFLFIEDRLMELVREINTSKGRLNDLITGVKDSKVFISLTQAKNDDVIVKPDVIEDSLSTKMKQSFLRTWKVLVGISESILLFLAAWFFPIIIGVAALICIGFLKRREKQALMHENEKTDITADKKGEGHDEK